MCLPRTGRFDIKREEVACRASLNALAVNLRNDSAVERFEDRNGSDSSVPINFIFVSEVRSSRAASRWTVNCQRTHVLDSTLLNNTRTLYRLEIFARFIADDWLRRFVRYVGLFKNILSKRTRVASEESRKSYFIFLIVEKCFLNIFRLGYPLLAARLR